MSAHPSHLRLNFWGPFRVAWDLVRLPLFTVLSLLAPVVQSICAGLMILGLFVSVLFKISAAGPTFPFWHMIGISLGFGLFVLIYYALIGLLAR